MFNTVSPWRLLPGERSPIADDHKLYWLFEVEDDPLRSRNPGRQAAPLAGKLIGLTYAGFPTRCQTMSEMADNCDNS